MNYTDFRNQLFYTLKPLIPRPVQVALRRQIARYKRKRYAHIWPIDPKAGEKPLGWPGWPDGKQFALVLSHDVDTRKGYDNALKLAELEENMGFRSQFNFVPERYGEIEIGLLDELKSRGFGVGVHGLHHDGKLFSSKKIFYERAPRINEYLKKWGTRGFTTPSMIRNHEWMLELEMGYCVSTFDTDPFEPQSDGVGTIFPFLVHSNSIGPTAKVDDSFSLQSKLQASQPASEVSSKPPGFQASLLPSGSYSQPLSFFLELPYTLVQDFTLFVLLEEKYIDLWTQKLDWIASKGGMALLNSHPDYMNFTKAPCGSEEYDAEFYRDFLKYAKSVHQDRYWQALPFQVRRFWETRGAESLSTRRLSQN